jgi:polar amino acid transport system permease protein
MKLDLDLLREHAPELLSGAGMTMATWLAGAVAALLLGFVIALLRCYGRSFVAAPLRLVVDLVRGTPFLIQLFLLYYGGPFIGLSMEPVTAGILGLAVYGGAYFSEIFRSGFEAVPRGYIEAAECLGMHRAHIVWRILVPEMLVLVFPAATNMAIILLKETAVLSVVTVPELTLLVGALGSQYYAFAEALLLLALFYWGLITLCSRLGAWAEARLTHYRHASV